MSECEILKRKLKLKRQAVKVMREEIRDIQARLFLIGLRDRLSARSNGHTDRVFKWWDGFPGTLSQCAANPDIGKVG